MLSKCANPGCSATFLYLHEGKLFRMDSSGEIPGSSPVARVTKTARRVEFFWLCAPCAAELTLGYNKETGITVVPLAKGLGRAQTA